MESEVDIFDMLTLQLAEVEMLQSMFPQSQEFVLDDPLVLDVLQTFVDEKKPYEWLNGGISFTLHLNIGDEDGKASTEACIISTIIIQYIVLVKLFIQNHG